MLSQPQGEEAAAAQGNQAILTLLEAEEEAEAFQQRRQVEEAEAVEGKHR